MSYKWFSTCIDSFHMIGMKEFAYLIGLDLVECSICKRTPLVEKGTKKHAHFLLICDLILHIKVRYARGGIKRPRERNLLPTFNIPPPLKEVLYFLPLRALCKVLENESICMEEQEST